MRNISPQGPGGSANGVAAASGPGPCRICGNSIGNKAFAVREMMFGMLDEFAYFQCLECGCLQIQDIPADMSKYYPPDYYSIPVKPGLKMRLRNHLLFLRDDYAFSGRGLAGKIMYALAPSPALRHVRSMPLSSDVRILDVGSGDGKHLRVLAGQGFTNLSGVDPNISEDLEIGPQVKIFKKTMEEFQGEFDLVMLHHSLEHMADQRSAFASIARLLAPGGTALIRVPTVSSYAWENYGVHWIGLDAPRHFYLHSIRSLRLLASASGLTVTRIAADSTSFQFWGSEQYEKGIFLNSRRSLIENPIKLLLKYPQLRAMEKQAAVLNKEERGDQLAMWAKKD